MRHRKKRMTGSMIMVLSFMMIMTAGCTHQLDIKNFEKYRTFGPPPLEKPLKIGITTNTMDTESCHLLMGTAMALKENSATVFMPYNPKNQNDVDVVAYVDIMTERKGSGWNFLINFPGFLIFTPAWHGYMYEVNHTVHCTLVRGAGENKEVIDRFTIPIALDIRHAGMNRTWTEVSYLEIGAIALIGGIVFITYDDSITPQVGDKTIVPIGKYIAHEIMTRINSAGTVKPKTVQ